jgi:ABC-type branched-subunit amino acid transport system ATPase component/ABC-type branched-subunit amino acid transport system permease subunit
MGIPLQFALIGLGAGALYGLAALGLVLVYRGSGVINFAHGAIGAVGTYFFYELHDLRGLSFVAAFVPAMALCAFVGLLIQGLVMWPLRNASGLTRLLATLGVLATLQGALSLRYGGGQQLILRSSLPRSTIRIFRATVGWDRVIIFGLVLLLALVLFLVYRFTKFGLATSAVSENARSAGHLGYSPNAVAGANWALGSMLAGTAGILLAPITGLSIIGLTLLVIPALAVAVAGRMVSFPITMAAGLAVGIIQSEFSYYVTNPGWSASVPFFLIIGVLTFRGTSLPTRGFASMRLPSVGTGRIRLWLVVPAVVAGILAMRSVPPDWVAGLTNTAVIAIVVLSVVVITGYAGQVSLAQWAFAGVGAWIAATLVASHGYRFEVALLIGVAVMIPIGFVLGLPALRTRGDQLAIVTLGLAVAIQALIFDQPTLTGAAEGLNVGTPTVFGIKVDTIVHPRTFGILVIVTFAVAALGVANLRRGRTGRRLLALRSNERAAASLGISVAGAKLYAFAFSAMLASLGGILFAFRNPVVTFGVFGAANSVSTISYAVIGGLGYTTGPLVGSTLYTGGVGTNIANLLGTGIQRYLSLAGGIILILMLIQNQDGIVAAEIRRWAKLGGLIVHRFRGGDAPGAPSEELPMPATSDSRFVRSNRVTPRTLKVTDLCVRFGGNQVLTDVSLEVKPGKVLGLIGPNGAGKTTLIDAVTGYVQPSHGTVHLDDLPLTSAAAHKRAQAGIARSYQSLELFDDMTVLENLIVASEPIRWWHFLAAPFYATKPTITPATQEAIDVFGLSEVLQSRPTDLAYGQRRLVAIARAVAAEPSVLLLDEPAAGLSESERMELKVLIRHLAVDRGLAILLIEHDVPLVMSVCDDIVALDFGDVIARGDADHMRTDAKLIAAYLGQTDEHDIGLEHPERPAMQDIATHGSLA